MAKEFSFDFIFDYLKEAGTSLISNPGDKIYNFFDGITGGFLGMILKGLGLEKDVAELKTKADVVGNELTASLDKDLVTARTATTKQITQFFEKNKSSLKLDDQTLASIQQATQDVAGSTGFYKEGIPKLDEKGRPIKAYATAIDFRATLVTQLKGDGTSIGALPESIPKAERDQLAETYATLISGVPADATLIDLAAKPPTTGLVAMLASTQTKRHAEGFVKESLREGDIAMATDTKFLASMAANPKIAGGDDVKTNTPPPAGHNPNKNTPSQQRVS